MSDVAFNPSPAIRAPADVSAQPSRLWLPSLAPFYVTAERVSYALLRAAFGLSMLTHGLPKLLGIAHGSMANPRAGATNLIGNVLGLPAAPMFFAFITFLETAGALAVSIGLLTRVFAPMFAVQMAVICYAMSPTYAWIDRGYEYPLVLGFIALFVSFRGGGAFSMDGLLHRQL